MPLACLDGKVGPVQQATIPVTDDGLLRGDGVFEVLRLYAGRPFALDAHLARLGRSAAGLRLEVDVELVRSEAQRLLQASGPVDAVLRIVLTRGGHRLLLIESLPAVAPKLRLALVTYAPTRILDGVKSLSYAANMLASRLARERGFDEALLVTPHGRVLEAPTASFFWARAGALYTPPLSERILASITRARVMELMGAREQTLSAERLDDLDEAFLASSLREVLPIVAIEDRELGAPGPLSALAAQRLRAHIAAEVAG